MWQKSMDLVEVVYVMIAGRLRYAEAEHTAGMLERIAELSRMLTVLRQRLIEPV